VTVIIPTFNWSGVLPHSIGSVLRQTRSDFELLVIGDGCMDDSEVVVAGIGDPRVRWINLPANTGHQSGPNNEGLRQARGDFIAYLGHDDLWLPDHLEKLVAALERGADLAYGIVEVIAGDGQTRTPAPVEMANYREGIWIPPSGVAHRREAALKAGGWPNFSRVDRDPEQVLWAQMHNAGCKFAFIPSLTAVKFSASLRKDVYKTRPTHEQAAWSARIQSEADFQTVELLKMLSCAVNLPMESKPFVRVFREFLLDFRGRVRRRLFGRPRIPALTREEFFNKRRRFKGLDPKPPP
jgi:glycosyltransferase involved in cell wall biosynthesis